jgi:hypothetical protein
MCVSLIGVLFSITLDRFPINTFFRVIIIPPVWWAGFAPTAFHLPFLSRPPGKATFSASHTEFCAIVSRQ